MEKNDSNSFLTKVDNGKQARKQTKSSEEEMAEDVVMIHNSAKLQLFIPIQTPTTLQFLSDIPSLFNGIPMNFETTSNSTDISEKLQLVVTCQVLTRTKIDIDTALEQIKYDKPFIVLLVYSGVESSLPILATSAKLAYIEKYRNVEFIDVAYNMEKRFYNCRLNERAKIQLERFFERNHWQHKQKQKQERQHQKQHEQSLTQEQEDQQHQESNGFWKKFFHEVLGCTIM